MILTSKNGGRRKNKFLGQSFVLAAILCFFYFTLSGCWFYSFSEKSTALPDSIRTVKIDFIENRAPYVNPQLSPTLTERLRLKITSQTKLTQTNNDNADWFISGYITDYSVSTTGVSSNNGQSESTINRLTVSVHMVWNRTKENIPPIEFDIMRQFDFGAQQSLQTAEAVLLDEMVKNLTDEIFNRIFSDW